MFTEEDLELFKDRRTLTRNNIFGVSDLVQVYPLGNIKGHPEFKYDYDIALVTAVEEYASAVIYTVLGFHDGKLMELDIPEEHIDIARTINADVEFLEKLRNAFIDIVTKFIYEEETEGSQSIKTKKRNIKCENQKSRKPFNKDSRNY